MITRRSLFAGAASLGLSAALGTPPVCAAARRAPLCDPFQLGIASGEPASDGVVLWTRLAMDPVALDGLGGMPDRAVPVQWELARDEGFRRVVRRGGPSPSSWSPPRSPARATAWTSTPTRRTCWRRTRT
ncbi:Alkaline phosphatase D precursor [Nonomuraea coxensis DSM 45129]|uniref:Alkaline phosphatase D n=1 Tax=Nonomuraea coxensis DSM 45129 TaxID=1122611 RepID=A0ABX8U6Z5_9ACTN|nr:Alkaline phosphatase D precursor [Nonomuraea coxensis DSM 45129]